MRPALESPPSTGEPRLSELDEVAALRAIVAGTAAETGELFFAALVRSLAQALNTDAAWVTEYDPETRRLRALAFWFRDGYIQGYEHAIDGTPCELVIDGRRLVHLPDNALTLYPNEPDLKRFGAVSYLGVPLLDGEERVLGHLAVMHTGPLPGEPRTEAIFRIFAARAAAELRRVRAEAERQEREQRLQRLVDGAMDAILSLDDRLTITLFNRAAEQIFRLPAAQAIGLPVARLFTADSHQKLRARAAELGPEPTRRQSTWITDGLTGIRADGSEFAAEATLSHYEEHGRPFLSLVLRDVNERIEAERRLSSLAAEADDLRAELGEPRELRDVLGKSPAMKRVLEDLLRVAPTDTTVLLLGETGTGKSFVARALHAASSRSKGPFIKVNCAAIPAALLESEFFGHVKGAFTGATQKRDGRFLLADGGTIFLDEIGDLPPDLQVKLLHVLQEGEFEPVGSAVTKKVDVRVIAATSRNLRESMARGAFREDLYYRLNVFPVELPPLRDRGDDVIDLANAFIAQFSKRMGKPLAPLTEAARARLLAYSWPGNVRELENVIERAVILGRGGEVDVERAVTLGGDAAAEADRARSRARSRARPPEDPSSPRAGGGEEILTAEELKELEKENILRALAACEGRISGEAGAARLLGMNPSTLSSRIKALGIKALTPPRDDGSRDLVTLRKLATAPDRDSA